KSSLSDDESRTIPRRRRPQAAVLKRTATIALTTEDVVEKQSKLKNYLHYIGNWFRKIWNHEGVKTACCGLFLILFCTCAIGGAFYLIGLFGPQGRKPMGF
ncbi:unnamed protein product, partial [Rotaria sordida]